MILRGRVFYPKVLAPQKKYQSEEEEWSLMLEVDDDIKKVLKEKKVRNKINIKDIDGEEIKYINLRKDVLKKDKTPAKPIDVIDREQSPWPTNKLIGNGSVCNVQVFFSDRVSPDGEKFTKMSMNAVQVWEHIPFEASDGSSEFPTGDNPEDWAE